MILEALIHNWVPQYAKVIDLGCGDGTLLESLHQLKSINPYGVEIDQKKILSCLSKNIPVIQADIDESIRDFEGLDFDIAILASSIQCLRHPDKALSNILSIAKKCIVTVPNFAHWQCRLQLSQGKMPVTKDLPAPWYATDNIHLCTIKDFEMLCIKLGLQIDQKKYLGTASSETFLSTRFPNLFASLGVYLIGSK